MGKIVTALLVLVLLVAALAAPSGGEERPLSPPEAAARTRAIEMRAAAAAERDRRIGEGAFLGLFMFGLLGGGGVLLYGAAHLARAHRQHALLYPGPDGQMPLVRMRTRDGRTILYDPNRAPTAVVAFEPDGRPAFLAPDNLDLQALALRGAQHVQATRAAVSGNSHPRAVPAFPPEDVPPLRRLGRVEVLAPEDVAHLWEENDDEA